MKPGYLAVLLFSCLCSQLALAQPVPGEVASQGSESAKSKPKVYKFKVGGVTSFSDIPPAKGHFVVWTPSCFACDPGSAVDWHSTRLYPVQFSLLIEAAAHKYAVDPALVRAVIHAESGFNPQARSHKGAIGLMQLMPATARQLGVADARQPSDNIQAGVQYLAGLLERFNGDVTLAAAAYNAGPEAVTKYAGVPPYAETQVYVQRIQILRRRYQLNT